VRKRAKTAAGVGLAAVAVVGALHMPFARPLLMKLGGCPVGKASAAEIERARVQAVASTRGEGQANARPAIGFALDASTPDDVRAWAEKNGVSCTEKREGMFLACKNVPIAALADRASEPGVADDVSFAFRPSDRALVNVTVTWFALPADLAAARAASATARLDGEVGKATAWSGDATAEHLASGMYATASASWRFADYQADVTATSFGARGVAVREHYVSGRD
jgi:hypothetical protein